LRLGVGRHLLGFRLHLLQLGIPFVELRLRFGDVVVL
jgi:hypothetical protein